MYPFIRHTISLIQALSQVKKGQTLTLNEVSEIEFRCQLTDIDDYFEMNNGRILTLYDLGRMNFAVRTGLGRQLFKQRWNLIVAGTSIQYRKRVRAFDKVTMKTQIVGIDARWIYIEQSMWVKGKPCSSALLRTGITKKGKLVETAHVLAALGQADWLKPPEPWVQEWIDANEDHRWPPMGEIV
ncbi:MULTISPECIES: acyl-CoA thioesterase [unclassified Psychrobacter]|uniref:acyl-CoA thioesterase n=1 Tax=unclassified Psychrobacter TaxID=196806 RepID=UPI003FD5BB85